MNKRLVSTICMLMMFTQFMGPFVLMKSHDAEPTRKLRSDGTYLVFLFGLLFVIVGLIIGLIGLLLMSTGVFGIIALLVVKIGSGVCSFGLAIWGLTFGVRHRYLSDVRMLSKEEKEPVAVELTEVQKLKKEIAILRIKAYVAEIEDRYNIKKLEAEAKNDSFKKTLSKIANMVLKKNPEKVEPAPTKDELKIAYRNLYDTEFEDKLKMDAEILEIYNRPDYTTKPHTDQVRKCRRKYLKLRIMKVVDLIQRCFYQDRKYKNSWDYKYPLNKIEIDQILAKLKDPKTTPEQKKAAETRIEEIMKKEDSKKTPEEHNKLLQKELSTEYTRAGVREEHQRMKFFPSYVKASFITTLKMERIAVDDKISKNVMTKEQIEIQKKAQEDIDSAIDRVYLDIDLN